MLGEEARYQSAALNEAHESELSSPSGRGDDFQRMPVEAKRLTKDFIARVSFTTLFLSMLVVLTTVKNEKL